jgi:putative FmdB family regulatory protein
MPTYEYTCRDCGHTFDIVQSMWDEALTMCPECGGSLRKVFAPPAISFKGSGFYATDHGRRSKRSDDAKDDGKRSGDTGEKKGSAASKEPSDSAATEGAPKPARKEPAPS